MPIVKMTLQLQGAAAPATVAAIAIIFLLCVSVINGNLENIGQQSDDTDGHSGRDRRAVFSNQQEETAHFWNINAQLHLRDQLLKKPNTNTAKNAIIFLGDGMSTSTVAAARIYAGQQQGLKGEESKLSFEEFPYTGLSKTYCVDKQVADSACSATAYLCGVKANYGTIGVTAAVPRDNCEESSKRRNHVNSLAMWAQAAGKGTGIVTTTRVTHASPSGMYAHVGSRDWECDGDVLRLGQDPAACQDIASQLVLNVPGKNFKVILGGGRSKFLPKGIADEEGGLGQRIDNVNLIELWRKTKRGKARYVHDKQGLAAVDFNTTDYLLGLFESEHMRYHLDADPETEPTLAEMTLAALKQLQKEENGFVLFVEGGRIDHAHHESLARKAVDETVQFAEAVRTAVEATRREDTLIVVTSDHAHTMTLAGYSNRGTDVLGLNTQISSVDGLPYTSISYANGPGHKNQTRPIVTEADTKDKNYQYPALYPLELETHGGEDVGVYALGPWSHLFSGAYEQNVIPHIIAYATCIGDGLTACKLFT